MSEQQQSAPQPQSAFQPAPSAFGSTPAASPAADSFTLGGTQVATAPTRLPPDRSVFNYMADFGSPARLGATPTAEVTGGQVTGTGASASAELKAPPTVAAYGASLDKELDADIAANRTTRALLDSQRPVSSSRADETENGLNGRRQQMLGQLNERSAVFDHDIAALDAQVGQVGKNPTPEQKELLAQRDKLKADRDKYSSQQTALQRWQQRNEINDMNAQLAGKDLDPKDRAAIEERRDAMGANMLTSLKRYSQRDEKWGATTYGGKGASNMKTAGCGPTALADVMDYHDQEDPEGQHSRGVKDPYDPRKMADYATKHGRAKSGTDGAKMMGDLQGTYSGVKGNTLGAATGKGTMAKANESLRSGVPVLFSGRQMNGKNADGKAAPTYKNGHYMVLSGISKDGQTYSVQDGGRADANCFRTMDQKAVSRVGNMYNVQNSHPSKAPQKPPAAQPNS